LSHRAWRNIEPGRPVAIVRLDDLAGAVRIARALLEGGINTLEFTLTNAQAADAIGEVKRAMPGQVIVGAGTVLDAASARACVEVGAEFLVTPAFLPEVIEVGRDLDVTVMCGALTPTEILSAWRAGADFVKVFPAGRLGPGYIKDVLAPLPDLRLVPTGGINLDNCAQFLAAGAYTVAIGSSLVSQEIVAREDWAGLAELAGRYVERCVIRNA
jgi:2-dehydro-3-deoxyphosphogluconate aldolase / (4S)-4-hydroxy-2-oxoglutarate aldolase